MLESKRPLILAGNGIDLSNANDLLSKFITSKKIPTVCSLPGIGVIDSTNDYCFGFIGHTGEFYSNLAMYYSDLLLVIGARLDIRQTGTEVTTLKNKKVIHVDIDKNEIKFPRIKTDIKLNIDCKEFLFKINKYKFKCDTDNWIKKIKVWKSKYYSSQFYKTKKLSSFHIISKVSQKLQNSKIIVTSGVGTHQQLVPRYFNFSFPSKKWFTSAGHGTMGYDLPTAIGCLIADKSLDFGIVFVGDGSFQMNIQELTNVANFNLPLKIFVLDNKRLGIVSQFQLLNWDDDLSTGKKNNPEFSKIAKSYGISAHKITNKTNIESVLKKVFSNKEPSLVHCIIDEKEDVLPMLLAGQKMNEMHPFKNQVEYMNKLILITGGSRGIGKSIVENLIKLDYDIAFTYNKKSKTSMEFIHNLNTKNNINCFQLELNNMKSISSCLVKLKSILKNLYLP